MKKLLLLLLLILIFALTIGAFLMLNSSSKALSEEEKQQALSKILGRKANLNEANTPVGDTAYKGKYITFTYPKAAKIYTLRPPGRKEDKSYLEDFIYDLDSPKIAFFMEALKASESLQSIEDFPNVKVRNQAKGLYEKKTVEADRVEGVSFLKTESGIEKSAFFFKEGRIFSISIQGNDLDGVEELFDKTLSTLKFL